MGEVEVNYKEVPSVQELAKKKLVTIPSRYVRDDQDRSIASSNYKEVPVIDMQRLINSNDHDAMNLELNKLHFAAQDWGFFQLINHGVRCSVVDKMKHEIQKFFDLPLEEKKKFEPSAGDTDGFGQLFVVSDEQKLDWADLFYLKTAPSYLRRPIFSNLYLSLRETIEVYSEEVNELSMKVLEMLGKALGIEEKEVKNVFEEGMQTMRMNYYPACPQPDKVMGLTPHSDAAALTILLQVNETQGLQIRKDGIWIPVEPLPNAFVVNVGDALELGGSLPVPSVQQLAKGSPENVPARYLRDDQPLNPMIESHDRNIPIINMESLLRGDEFEFNKLDSACREWGFFQVINHGVSGTLVEKVKKDTQDFFNLPLEEKEMLKQVDGDMDGYGQAFVVSEDQKLDWADMFFVTTLPPQFRKQHIFPQLPQPFRGTVELYAVELKKLALKILDFLAKALNMDEEYIRELFGEGMQSMRMNYYPPCPQPEKVIGLTPHSDAVGLTILLQLNQMEGLQIRKDGMWIPISPLPDAFIINIGDIMEIVTNGAYRSIEHRAVVNSEKERLSIATFYSTKLDGQIGPAPSIISAENPAKFRSIGTTDYVRGLFARKLDKKSYLDVMRIGNSENPAS